MTNLEKLKKLLKYKSLGGAAFWGVEIRYGVICHQDKSSYEFIPVTEEEAIFYIKILEPSVGKFLAQEEEEKRQMERGKILIEKFYAN